MRSVRAPVTPVRRLPVRVEPLPGEAWCGYLDRVAASAHTTTRSLRQHLGLGPHGDAWVPSHRDHGVTMTPQTRTRLATLLDLAGGQLARMQVQHFDTTVLHMSPELISALDPSGQPDGRDYAGTNIHRAGWAEYRPFIRACSACRAERPKLWLLSWRLRWHVACVAHEQLIDDPAVSPRAVSGIDDELVVAQDRMLALADGRPDPSGRPAGDITRDVMAAIEIELFALDPPDKPRDLAPSPAQMADLLPAALDWVLGSHGTVLDLRRGLIDTRVQRRNAELLVTRRQLAVTSPVRAAVTRRLAVPPSPVPQLLLVDIAPEHPVELSRVLARRVPGCIPQCIPMDLYRGDPSDLLYPAPLRFGRLAAAIACVISAKQCSPMTAARTLALPTEAVWRLASVWQQLYEDGRDDRAWDTVGHVVQVLAERGIDYPTRRRLASTPKVLRLAVSIADPIEETIARRWLLEYWAHNANQPPVGRNNAGREQRALDRLEAVHGPELQQAMHQLEHETAAAS
jgi:hypothetical protein